MKSLYKVLIVLIVLGAGAAYYAKRKNIDIKSLFSSKCDCHTGCNLKKAAAPAPTPASIPAPTPEPAKTPSAPVVPTPAASTPAPATTPAK